jgi:ferredoxin-NADP reductase
MVRRAEGRTRALEIGVRRDQQRDPHDLEHFRGGIGITPFLSMLAFELSNHDFRRIWLYYVVRNEQDAVFDAEIRETYLSAESYIDYEMWPTATRGRITAAEVASQVALDDYAVMLCGHMAFVADLARQFTALGVPRERIITEEFEFR